MTSHNTADDAPFAASTGFRPDPRPLAPGLYFVSTPIGAARLDFGYRINRRGAGEPEPTDDWAWHLTIGEAF